MCIQCADNTYIVFITLHISLPNTLEPGDKISAVVAAAVHDIHHLGFANSFFAMRQIHLQFYIMILRIREPSCCIIF